MEVYFIKSHKLRNAIPDDKLKEKYLEFEIF
jgi:hypothetical protein